MTDEETARLRAQVHEATRVLSGSYTIPAPRQAALTEEYAETFAAAVERMLDERAALVEIVRGVATADTLAYESDAGDDQRCSGRGQVVCLIVLVRAMRQERRP